MSDQSKIREAHLRRAQILRDRPSKAKYTGTTMVRLEDGLRCEVEQKGWRIIADQPTALGGDNLGPDPGFLGRAALGVCAAQGYAIWLARHGVPHRAIEVRVEGDSDSRGFLGVDDVTLGYQAIRLLVNIESDADEKAVTEALDAADQHSPWLDNFVRPLKVTREVTIAR